MDWRAIEQNEQELRAEITAALAEGTEEGEAYALAADLQLGLMRPWLAWVAKTRVPGQKHIADAVIMNLATMMGESAVNMTWLNKDGRQGTPEEILHHLSRKVLQKALELLDNTDRVSTSIDLGGRADA